MAFETLAAFFAEPVKAREQIIRSLGPFKAPIPFSGSSFFIHLSELCPVACEHCMYSSDLTSKSLKDALDKEDLEDALCFIDESHSQKLNITGGGEPFLKFGNILRLVEAAKVPVIEIVTAGHWAKTQQRATTVLRQLGEAGQRNGELRELRLRLSLDRYHVGAPRPVLLEYYANAARAWASNSEFIGLGFRSIQPDRGVLDAALAQLLGGHTEVVNDWNHVIVFGDNKRLPITFNVMRFSGKAEDLHDSEELSTNSMTIKEYYTPFERAPGRLNLATTVNDAIKSTYTVSEGVAITLNSDGTYWIFSGTSPERKLKLGTLSFQESVAYFFEDPITRFLVDDGIWALAEMVKRLDLALHDRAFLKNDVAFLVEDLLANARIRLAVTVWILKRMIDRGDAGGSSLPIISTLCKSREEDLLSRLTEELSRKEPFDVVSRNRRSTRVV
ncbi:4Fe-4S cluster-binding domain-containing protein [Rhizobium sp. VS19-DR104.2]|uniref:4Fe-4S cluster-binding domain-containing protein n=1 Tax=unclassified Rhizobium TaxID=2613769 RepID=UPI001C5BFB86|nr:MULTISPECIES: 4Fe-4S cluster-binding domain-containing protein [unclassified Rhizobium]MBZ5762105.1 4Fe-4S cluster-binding domain-containing protein [Rhizobium sp. VS19-DR96]MBZ5768218.1 4Fe-4S cluster-binding domain-containing protein [Rhizobium sp. VS19-DR129.2]MBZ5775717.1 4Fe-4S cluster-binding domain-containing protein [Rhizobium sp. VS19-DRK62.2]MBZ5786982.1 4Fe-4S cluster-binding domain-containing protein [Rhizobium sp. VS19-DR121]MBZ5804143.1 4Fe-4S cluster-binding domain-containing